MAIESPHRLGYPAPCAFYLSKTVVVVKVEQFQRLMISFSLKKKKKIGLGIIHEATMKRMSCYYCVIIVSVNAPHRVPSATMELGSETQQKALWKLCMHAYLIT
jgi:hypothetical protein